MRSRSSNFEKNSVVKEGYGSQSGGSKGPEVRSAEGNRAEGYRATQVYRGSGSFAGESRARTGNWVLQLSFSQVLVMWSVIAGVMILSFLFGLFAGREQGLETALEEYRQQGARIPLAEPQAVTEEANEVISAIDNQSSRELTEVAKASNSRSDGSLGGDLSEGKDPSDHLVRNPDGIFDFSESRVDPVAAGKSELPSQEVSEGELKSSDNQLDRFSKSTTDPRAKVDSNLQQAGGETELFASSNSQAGINNSSSGVARGGLGLGQGAGAEKNPATDLKANGLNSTSKAVEASVRNSTDKKIDKKEPSQQKPEQQKTAQKIGPPSSGWYVQVAATRVPAQAADVIAACKKSGFEVAREVAKVRDSSYYRVLVGPYASREAALKVKEQVKQKRISRTEPFLKRIR